MNDKSTETLSIAIERELPYPREKVWRALTQPELLAEWLMKNDFAPVVDRRFHFTADWGSVECRVLAVDPITTLSYTWGGYGLESVVTFTLAPTPTGTAMRMEHTGFRADQQQFYQGAKQGWPRFVAALEDVLARTD